MPAKGWRARADETNGVSKMDLAVRPRTPVSQSASCRNRERREALASSSVIMLPVLTRSVSLLRLLLRDSAIDLELASSVVGLDPGMSLGTLQLANARRHQGDDPIWQLPSAVVQAGRERLEHFILHAPTIESPGNSARRAQLEKVVEDAVVRACVAHGVTRELGQSNPRKAFLCALLFVIAAPGAWRRGVVMFSGAAVFNHEPYPAGQHGKGGDGC